MLRSLVIVCLGALITMPAWAATTHAVPPRSSVRLANELCAAQMGEGAQTIELAQGSRYELRGENLDWTWRPGSPFDDDEKFIILPSPDCGDRTVWHLQVSGNLTIRGNGSVVDLKGGFGFFVEEQASLTIEDLEFVNAGIFGAVYNQGKVELNRVTIRKGQGIHDQSNGDTRGFTLPIRAAGVNNFGTLTARNVYIANNKLRVPGRDPEAPCVDAVGGIYNAGFANINNATFDANKSIASCGARSIFNDAQGVFEVSNSLLGQLAPNVCLGTITSLGFNFEGRAQSCGLDGSGDISTAQVGGYNVSESTNAGGILYPVIFLSDITELGSPATGGPGSCDTFDIRGYTRLSAETGRCDIGAVEHGARGAPGEFTGTWLKPSKDGHYLSITQLREQTVLLIWNTFDDQGARLWIYGVGTRSGREVKVDAFQNTGGRLTENGLVPAEAEPWGELRFRASSCTSGIFVYSSNNPAQGSGEIQVSRVASSDQLLCVEF